MSIKNETLDYFKKWATKDTIKARHLFIEMLQSKTFFAKSKKKSIIAGGKLRTGSELNAMLCYADDFMI